MHRNQFLFSGSDFFLMFYFIYLFFLQTLTSPRKEKQAPPHTLSTPASAVFLIATQCSDSTCTCGALVSVSLEWRYIGEDAIKRGARQRGGGESIWGYRERRGN